MNFYHNNKKNFKINLISNKKDNKVLIICRKLSKIHHKNNKIKISQDNK